MLCLSGNKLAYQSSKRMFQTSVRARSKPAHRVRRRIGEDNSARCRVPYGSGLQDHPRVAVGAEDERAAFNRLVASHLDELLRGARRELRLRTLAPVSLEARPPPEPIQDDDESFWEWYRPDEVTRWEDLVAEPGQLSIMDSGTVFHMDSAGTRASGACSGANIFLNNTTNIVGYTTQITVTGASDFNSGCTPNMYAVGYWNSPSP